MPRMKDYLETNGPWKQLVSNQNIEIQNLQNKITLELNEQIQITPIQVPHRDEFSETVGYKIKGPNKSLLFIPDINKWSRWESDIVEELKSVDYALIDAIFYDGVEINNRDISEIPHPFVIETIDLFNQQTLDLRNKIYFIHLNHTNPLLKSISEARKLVESKGYHLAQMYDVFDL